jgi:guanylate kinase
MSTHPKLQTSILWEKITLVISGPSGVGKSTLLRRLTQEFSWLCFSISHTTRPPRNGEVNGRDYHFVTAEEFNRLKSEGAFIEDALVHGHQYGTSKQELQRIRHEGHTPLIEVDVQGALSIKNRLPSAVLLMVLPPSFEELRNRLNKRRSEPEEVQNRRLRRAIEEMGLDFLEHYNYFVVNDDLDRTLENIHSLLQCLQHQVQFIRPEFLGKLTDTPT